MKIEWRQVDAGHRRENNSGREAAVMAMAEAWSDG